MGTMLEHDEVVGVDVAKVRQALWLLAEAGMPDRALQSIRYELVTDECAHCHQHWQRKQSPVKTLPTWRYRWERGKTPKKGLPPKHLLEKLASFLEGYEEKHVPALAWRNAHTCETCVLEVADRLGKFVAALPKKLLNAFCRMFVITIVATREEFGRNWNGTPAFKGYVALVNAFMQNLKPSGNARALALLVKASHELGML
jgi:hypothetical protein